MSVIRTKVSIYKMPTGTVSVLFEHDFNKGKERNAMLAG